MLNENWKNPGPSDVSLELITANGEVGIHVRVELCQRVLGGFVMPGEWSISTEYTSLYKYRVSNFYGEWCHH